MRHRARGIIWLAVVWLSGAGATPSLLSGDASFEAFGAGFLLAGPPREASLPTALVAGVAAEGRQSLRLAADRPLALQSGWVKLEGGVEYHFSAALRATHPGLQAVVSSLAPEGQRQAVTFPLATIWRRHDAVFTLPEAGWRCFEIAGEGGPGLVHIDALRLDAGAMQPSAPEAVLGAVLTGPMGLRRAGSRTEFLLRLYGPVAVRNQTVRWRLEDPLGQVRALGSRRISLAAGELAEWPVRFDRLPPGAYRLRAETVLAGQPLAAEATVVPVSWELGGPEPWFGVQAAHGSTGLAALRLLRLGLERWSFPATGERPSTAELLARRRAGQTGLGELPAQGDADACARRVAAYRGLLKVWELPAMEEPLPVPAERDRIAAAAAGLRRADRGALGLLLQVDANPAGLARLSDLLTGLTDPGDGVILRLGPGEPEQLDDGGLPTLLAEARERLAGRPARIGVLSPGWAAVPWNSDWLPLPPLTGAFERLGALGQASRTVRSLLLARAGGADFYLYPGAPWSEQADRHTMLALGTSADGFSADGAILPWVAAIDQALDRLRNRAATAMFEPQPGLLCLQFDGRRPLAAVWCTDGPDPRAVQLPVPAAQLQATDCFGQRLILRGDERSTSLSLGRHPVFVETRGLDTAGFQAAWRALVALD